MISGALALSFALWLMLRALLAATTPVASTRGALIRISTMSPGEWRQYQDSHRSFYTRWTRPFLLLWAERLHLRPARLDRQLLEQAGIDAGRLPAIEFQALRIACGGLGLVAGLSVAALIPGFVFLVPVTTWTAFLLPARHLARRRRERQAQMRRELPDLLGIVRAFHRAGVPLERTLHLLGGQQATFPILGAEIAKALTGFGFGVPLEDALGAMATRTGLLEIALVVGSLSQSKRLGSALDEVLKDHETAARAAQRNQATAEASRVGTKLLAILAGVYLPEFVLLIMIPLFLGIVQRAFG
jgi:Flp pilus assembly protein TadB